MKRKVMAYWWFKPAVKIEILKMKIQYLFYKLFK
jgi:hypothetical protein